MRLPKIQQIHNKCGQGKGAQVYPFIASQMQNVIAKGTLTFPYKVKFFLLHSLTTVSIGIWPNELKLYVHPKACVLVFITTSFIVSQTLNYQNTPSAR